MGTHVSVFANEPNKFMYGARKSNSYVQVEVDLSNLVPKLELVWFSNHWRVHKHKDHDTVCQELLQKIARKIQKNCDLSPNLTIEKVVYKPDKTFYLQNNFELLSSTVHWCKVGTALQQILDR